MYALVQNGIATKYPYAADDLRRDNPQVSFPMVMSTEMLAKNGVVEVVEQPQPAYNIATQRVETENLPILINGTWTLQKKIVEKTPEQVSSDSTRKSSEVRSKRNLLLSDSDWTQLADSPVNKDVWATYRQALRDVTLQAGFPWDIAWPVKPE